MKVFIQQKERVESVAGVFAGANWSEREIYDMFGIFIINHPNLKRLLMPPDWHGHPLLKSYPLQGDDFAHWYEVDKIFGREYRALIGPEQRDQGLAVAADEKNFSRLNKNEKLEYQEEGGVKFLKRASRSQVRLLKKRR